MNDQIEVTFGEIGRTITGKTPSSADPEDFGEGYPFVTPTDSLESKYVLRTARQLSAEGLRKLKSKALPPDSVLVSCIGSAMGKVVMNSSTCITNQQFNSIIVDTHGFCPHYVYYALRNSYRLLRNAASGSTALPMLNKTDFEKLKIRVFKDKGHQRKIANVLSALDDKIALNHRINAELEAMAKLLYDYWFVQFDFPISAAQAAALGKPGLEGQPYRSAGGKMTHHPDLKREIPAGWIATELSEIANITMGQSPPGDTYNEERNGILFFQGSTDFGWRFPSPRQYTTGPTRIANKGDILLSVRAPVGTLNIAPEKCAIGRGLSALSSKSGCSSFLFQVLSGFKQVFARRNGDGTTFGSINRDDLRSLKLAYPADDELVLAYERIVADGERLIFVNHQQNQELAALRDWLLPMLMNGQVTVG